MFTLEEYIEPASLGEALQLLRESEDNVVLGGLMWMKMYTKKYQKGISLKKLGLNTITETDSEFVIGSGVTLRQLEKSEALKNYFGSYFVDAVKGIVGVQFRNSATVGGSVAAKAGFSDIICALLPLNAYVRFVGLKDISISEYSVMPPIRDIVESIIIKKDGVKASFNCFRNSATDLSVVNVAVSKTADKFRIAVGARPMCALLATDGLQHLVGEYSQEKVEKAAAAATASLMFGDNLRGSGEFRQHLSRVLINKGVTYLWK